MLQEGATEEEEEEEEEEEFSFLGERTCVWPPVQRSRPVD
jgi:hypothetical protein